MRGLRWRGFVTLIAVQPLLGCSLMGLDDFGVAPCRSNDDCDAAEAQLRPGPSACGAAVCQADTGFCAWQEAHEICNGKDDDCDGLIDEGLVFSTKASGDVSATFAASADVAYASGAEPAQTFVAVVADGLHEGFTLEPGAPVNELQYDSTAGPMGCPVLGGEGMCNFAEVALAADARHLVVASINTWGSACGQVRVGLSDIDDPFKVRLGKAAGEQSEEPSNIALGVGIDAGRCTGRDASTAGATRPAVASLGTEANGEGALLLWLAADASSTKAASDSIPVQALGLVVPQQNPAWLNGSNAGMPTELGRSTSLTTPAVVALKASPRGQRKYLVAFPSQQHAEPGIVLISAQVERAKLLVGPSEFLPVGAADQVLLALGNADRHEVGLAWRSSGASAQLCLAVFSPAEVTISEQILNPASVRCVHTPAARFAPQILYQSTGFATDEPTGGWFLSWVGAANDNRQTFQVARFRDGDSAPLNQARLHSGVIAQPVLYANSIDDVSRVGYALIQPSAAAPEIFPDWCSDRD